MSDRCIFLISGKSLPLLNRLITISKVRLLMESCYITAELWDGQQSFTDRERSSSYLLDLLWQPCSPDRVVLEMGPPSSLSSSIVDWRPGNINKHNVKWLNWRLPIFLQSDTLYHSLCLELHNWSHSCGGVVIRRVRRIPGGSLIFRGRRADYCGLTILRL